MIKKQPRSDENRGFTPSHDMTRNVTAATDTGADISAENLECVLSLSTRNLRAPARLLIVADVRDMAVKCDPKQRRKVASPSHSLPYIDKRCACSSGGRERLREKRREECRGLIGAHKQKQRQHPTLNVQR